MNFQFDAIEFALIATILASGLFCWVIALGELFPKDTNTANMTLLSLFGGVGLLQAVDGIGLAVFVSSADVTWFYQLDVVLIMTMAALVFIHFEHALVSDFELKKSHMIHFVPPSMAGGLAVAFIAGEASETAWSVLRLVASVSIVVYMGWLFRDVMLLWKAGAPKIVQLLAALVFLDLITYAIVRSAAFLLVDATLASWWHMAAAALLATTIMVIYLLTKRYPEHLGSIRLHIQKAKYSKSRIVELNLDGLVERVNHLFDVEKIYREEELTIRDLADELGLSVHQVSELLNSKVGKSFSHLVNERRVREAQQLLLDEPDKTVLAIAYQVGFNSRTSFNSAFLKYAGHTPVEYRKKGA